MSDYIPLDCLPEILKQLPVKSLARCRCVCRGWNALICSSSFIADHLACFKAKPRLFIDGVFLKPSRQDGYVIFDSDSHVATFIPRIIAAQSQALYLENEELDYKLVGSAKGIVCIQALRFSAECGEREDILLWNPVINRYMKLPEAHGTRFTSSWGYGSIAIGVKPSEDDIRVLVVSPFYPNGDLIPVVAVEIYSVRQGDWRALHTKSTPYFHDLHYDSELRPCVNGGVHWLGRKDKTRSYQLIRFGFEEEEFSCITLPDVLVDVSRRSALFVTDYCGKLVLLQRHREEPRWKIWARGGNEDDSWGVVFCHDPLDDGYIFPVRHGITHDGQILMAKTDYKQGDSHTDLVLYNLTSRTCRQLDMKGPPWVPLSVCTFVESLVFMDREGGALTPPPQDFPLSLTESSINQQWQECRACSP